MGEPFTVNRLLRRTRDSRAIVLGCGLALACNGQPGAPRREIAAVAAASLMIDSEGFDQLKDVDRLSDEVLGVVSGDGTQIALVDREGRAKRVGRRGSGPDEFLSCVAISPAGYGRYVTIDVGNRRIALWTLREGYVASRPLPGALSVGPWTTQQGTVMKVTAPGESGGQLYVIASPNGELLDSSKATAPVPETCTFCNMSVAADGAIASTSDPTSYTVVLRDAHGDSTSAIVGTGHPLVVLSPAELDSEAAVRESYRDKMRVSGMSDESITHLLKTFVPATTRGRFVPGGVRHDPLGRIWLQRIVAAGRNGEVDVFSGSGVAIATIVLPLGFRITRVYANEIIGLTTNLDGTMQVTLLRNPLAPAASPVVPQAARVP